ncbi:RNA polymerase sigma factor [Neotabrizicola shimadae]|uniref:RNA polymerase sigma factor n=1 Tax=Neotabrizicola shimadae TaxID=2807096 RepID=A0A8G1EC28_9RHOB|nr:RNA polymerase sigma factor [Neotabrizicola shimadae]QYZ68741.1 RNA polymerase sigma factor [Neotabrizicola shimadae]
MSDTLDSIWRRDRRRVLATLIRLLGDFDLAEEALHDAFLAATQTWPQDGVPANPAAWLISAGRFRAIDKLRRRARFTAAAAELALTLSDSTDDTARPDDPLRLIFTCCHPALSPEAQVALTLRTLCGLTTEEIARAFLVRTPTIAQRITRAKARLKDDRVPYDVPEPGEMPARLDPVLRVIYLMFNEGYSAHAGPDLLRADLSDQAIALGRDLLALLPDAEVMGLVALMLLTRARQAARQDAEGAIVLLADQDRSLWDRGLIAEGSALVERAFATRQIGPYTLQAAIAALHSAAATADQTDWAEILALYTVLLRAAPSPVVALNRAVALAMVQGPAPALALIAPLAQGPLESYAPAHAAQAEMLERLDRRAEAASAFRKALALSAQEPEQRHILRRIAALEGTTARPDARAPDEGG